MLISPNVPPMKLLLLLKDTRTSLKRCSSTWNSWRCKCICKGLAVFFWHFFFLHCCLWHIKWTRLNHCWVRNPKHNQAGLLHYVVLEAQTTNWVINKLGMPWYLYWHRGRYRLIYSYRLKFTNTMNRYLKCWKSAISFLFIFNFFFIQFTIICYIKQRKKTTFCVVEVLALVLSNIKCSNPKYRRRFGLKKVVSLHP